MTQVILGKSRVREICMPGSVRAKAKWLSYSTIPERIFLDTYSLRASAALPAVMRGHILIPSIHSV